MSEPEKQEISICIESLEKMLKKLDTKGLKFYEFLCDEHGEIKDYESFRRFFDSFLSKFPIQRLNEKYNNDQEAQNVWCKIDTNLNEIMDTDESINVVKEMINFVIRILKKEFEI